MAEKNKKPWVLGIVSALLGALLVWQFTSRRPSPPLTEASLAQARARWAENQIANYAMIVQVSGKQPHRHEIQVREGAVAAMITDGSPAPDRVWKYWSVEGLLQFLEEDLANQRAPQAAYGVDDPKSVFLDASFDPKTGVPVRYLRQVGGRPLTVEWDIVEFKRL